MTIRNAALVPGPVDGGAVKIGSSRLVVEIAAPGGPYRGSRFDWAGFVTQVRLDGEYTFCASEAPGGNGGVGLCNEFGIHTAVGYDEAGVGEKFVKPGVGLLTRVDEKPYRFFHNYAVEPFPIQVERSADCATFRTEALECNGYALRLKKTFQVLENQLRIEYTAENVGRRRIVVDEYRHNFIALNGRGPGPTQELSVPFTLEAEKPLAEVCINGSTITWPQVPTDTFHSPFRGFEKCRQPWWELVDEASGLGIRESTSFGWSRFALFGTAKLLSPEAFLMLDLAPGQQQSWQRNYLFFRR